MEQAIYLAAGLDKVDRKPLFRQLYDTLSVAIREGRITAGDKLPASRTFAAEIGVSRATVLAAYDQLAAEGYVETRGGSGVFVADIREAAPEWAGQTVPRSVPRTLARAAERLPLFYPGAPDMRLFPQALWAQYVGRVARAEAGAMLELADPFGDHLLRQCIADHLLGWRGVQVAAEQVVITAGAADAAELVLGTVAEPGDRIGLEDPGYSVLRETCRVLGFHPHWLEVDRHGARLPETGTALKVSILTPSYQFPLGGTMPVARRQAFLAEAVKNQGWLVEDDFDGEYRYLGVPVPAMMTLPGRERVIYLGSFSKVFSAGLRIGFLVFPPALIERARAVLKRRGVRASAMPQRVLARFMQDGEFHRHVRRMRRIYRGRRQVFLEGLHQRFGSEIAFDDHGAGMSVALRFARRLDEAKLEDALLSEQLHCRLLSGFYAEPKRADTGVLCGFCGFDEAEISNGLERMQTALEPAFWPG